MEIKEGKCKSENVILNKRNKGSVIRETWKCK